MGNLIENLAKALYEAHDTGEKPKRDWDLPPSAVQPSLDEYEKEDYRLLARTALAFLERTFKS